MIEPEDTSPSVSGRGDASKPQPQPQLRQCRGALWYSSSRHLQQRPPICGGLRTNPSDYKVASAAERSDTVPSASFKYMCLGVSVYDEARLRAAGAESRASPTEPVEIPFCEGLEIVSAANVQQSPALLGADAGAGAVPADSAPDEDRGIEQPRPPRPTFLPPGLGGDLGSRVAQADWGRFGEHFVKTAGKIVGKMQSNMHHITENLKKGFSDMFSSRSR